MALDVLLLVDLVALAFSFLAVVNHFEKREARDWWKSERDVEVQVCLAKTETCTKRRSFRLLLLRFRQMQRRR
jgi:hypothetical protein